MILLYAVVAQIAFSLALLTAAALFIRGAGKAASVDTGLSPGASFLLETDASLAGYDPKRGQDLYRSLEERLAALPAVEHASLSEITETFNHAFSDYIIPLKLTEAMMADKMKTENICCNLVSSVRVILMC